MPQVSRGRDSPSPMAAHGGIRELADHAGTSRLQRRWSRIRQPHPARAHCGTVVAHPVGTYV